MSDAAHDPGGKVRISARGYASRAIFGGPGDCYRYTLERTFDAISPPNPVMFCMMNPSLADESFDDPTVARCRAFALRWGHTHLFVGNTFAYRATDQRRLLEVDDPIGPENDAYLLDMAQRANVVVFAYGTPHKSLRARGPAVARMLIAHGIQPFVLRLSQTGTPWHPL